MKPQWFAGVVIGILLLYFGFMGASGIGLANLNSLSWSAPSTLPTREDFNDLGGWNPATTGHSPIINPAGQVELHASDRPGGGADTESTRSAIRSLPRTPGDAMDAATTMTISIKMLVDNWGQNGSIEFQLYTSHWWLGVDVYQNLVSTSTGASWPHTDDTAWHTYSMIISNSLAFTVDNIQVGTTTAFGPGVPSAYWGISLDAANGMLCHIDYVDIQSGAIISPLPETKYTLTINAQDNTGNSLSVPVTVTAGTDVIGPRSTPNVVFGPFSPGTYTVAVPSSVTVGSTTYGFTHWNDNWTNTSPTRNYDVESATTLTATYTSGQPGPSPSPSSNPGPSPGPGGNLLNGILGNLTGVVIDFLNNGQVRQLEMGFGGLAALVSGVMFILPGEKRYSRPPPGY